MDGKWKFVENQLLMNSMQGALQRANVYSDPTADTDPNRRLLRDELAGLLREMVRKYSKTVTSEFHEQNIQKIADSLTSKFAASGILRNDRFRIGIAQKVLNLYLKYLWCLGKVETPPHCPFDYGVIAQLPLEQQERERLRWTELDRMEDYRALVDAGRRMIATTGHSSLSEWELDEFNAR